MPVSTGWTQITPGWYGTTVASAGNGTIGFRYQRHEAIIAWSMMIRIGSTTSIPTGTWGFDFPFILPTQAFSTVDDQWSEWAAAAYAWDESAARMYTGAGRISAEVPVNAIATKVWPPTAYFLEVYFGTNTAACSATSPFTWATGDRLVVTGTVEAFDN